MSRASDPLTRRDFLLLSLFLGSALSTRQMGASGQAAIAQVSTPTPTPSPPPEINWANPYPARIIQGNNTFALDLFRKLGRDQFNDLKTHDSNLFFCPYSILTAFVMAYAGSREQTAIQMSETLHFPENTPELHTIFFELVQTLEKENAQYQLTAANKFWMRDDFQAEVDYLHLLRQFYSSEMGQFQDVVDLQNQANKWCTEKTQRRILEIFPDPPNLSTHFLLANAIYFKAAWLEPFKKKKTQPGQFYLKNGSELSVDMMFGTKRTFTYRKFRQHNVEVIELPYQGMDEDSWSTTSMAIILPNQGIDIQDFSQTLTYELIQELLSAEDEEGLFLNEFVEPSGGGTLHLTMPKLKLTSIFSIKSNLCGMGMTDVFSEANADFSGIHPLAYLIDAQHATFLEVNEEFTEAAGVTALSGGIRGTGSPIEITIDRPFILLILDASTRSKTRDVVTKTESTSDRSILFVGRIMNPKESIAAMPDDVSCAVDPDFQ